jgi:serine/threonine protein kinase
MRREITIEYLEKYGYTILNFLGKGASGIVFECIDKNGNRGAAKVVIKKPNSNGFENEMRAQKELEAIKPDGWQEAAETPGFEAKFGKDAKWFYKYTLLTQTRETDEIEGEPVHKAILWAPVAGRDAYEEFLKDAKTGVVNVDYEKLRKMGKSVLKVLKVLHAKGMVHFDIKPENILLMSTPQQATKFLVGDWGFLGDKNEHQGFIGPLNKEEYENPSEDRRRKGSPQYAAPELSYSRLSEDEMPKVDIYSLGATLFQIYLASIGKINSASGLQSSCLRLQSGIETFVITGADKKPNPRSRIFLEFVKKLTCRGPKQRPTAEQALRDPFLVKPLPNL